MIIAHRDPTAIGRTVEAIAEERGLGPFVAVCALVAEDPGAMVVEHGMHDDDVVAIRADPLIGVGSDNGPPVGMQHPRTWGCFPEFFGRCVRERGIVGWEEAIRKATSATALQFDLAHRGTLQPGSIADICVFDPETIAHPGSYAEPSATPVGINHVLLAGSVVVENGGFLGAPGACWGPEYSSRMPRRVRLVLCSPDGEPLGTLPEFEVETPWWPDVEPIVDIARRRFRSDIVVLRLLTADSSPPEMGGAVTYLAELVGDPPPGGVLSSEIVDSAGEDHALRADWARPGGVAATVTWADAALARIGRPRTERVVQVRSWNLSSILRLPTASGDVWCKSVPPFFAHEGAILALVGAEDPSIVPTVLAADPKRRTVLLDDVAGEDQYDASEPRLVEMVQRLVRLQARWSGRVDDLRTAGLPDWRPRPLRDLIGALTGRSDVREQLTVEDRAALDALVADLPRRLALLADCGLPETLVHGDFHPGNWRLGDDAFVLLDWGDSGIGHPMLDLAAFLPRVPDEVRERILATWLDAWNAEFPSADPLRASELVAPIAALRQALIYQGFLDGIEPDERRYHDADVADWLRRAIEGSSG